MDGIIRETWCEVLIIYHIVHTYLFSYFFITDLLT